jgi:hypothetical protein
VTSADVASATERLYHAFLQGDADGLGGCVTVDAFVAAPSNEGSGSAHLTALATKMRTPSFRTWSTDSFDVLASEYHGVVLDRWVDDARGLDAHITLLAADLQPDGRFGLVSIYGYDPAPISAFFD